MSTKTKNINFPKFVYSKSGSLYQLSTGDSDESDHELIKKTIEKGFSKTYPKKNFQNLNR